MSTHESPKRILVIDDSEAIHTDFRRIISQAQPRSRGELELLASALFGPEPTPGRAPARPDIEVDSALQGAEGVDKVRAALEAGRPYDLVFLDYRMPPGWNGAETLRHLREVAPTQPVVLCSAFSEYSWEDLQREFGDCPLLRELRKPFNGHEVRQLVMGD